MGYETHCWPSRRPDFSTRKYFRSEFFFKFPIPKYMGVSKNSGIPKWMVYNGKPIQIHDLVVPLFVETPISA